MIRSILRCASNVAALLTLFASPMPAVAKSTHHSAHASSQKKTATHSESDKVFKQYASVFQYDHTAPLSVVVTKTKRYPECVMLRVNYASANGERVPAIVFEPFRASRWHPVPAIILLHGLGGSKEDLVPFGHFLAATGYASLIIDEYGHGERKQEGQSADTSDSIRGFQQTVIDVRRGLDYLQTRPHISPHRIGILGFSLGAILAADVMGVDWRLRSGVFISGGGNVGVILKHLSEISPQIRDRVAGVNWQLANVLLSGVDPLTFAAHIGARPVLMQNGDADHIVVPDCAKALYRAIALGKKSHVEIDWCRGCGHTLPLGRIYPHMRVWLDKNLKGEMTDADTEILGR